MISRYTSHMADQPIKNPIFVLKGELRTAVLEGSQMPTKATPPAVSHGMWIRQMFQEGTETLGRCRQGRKQSNRCLAMRSLGLASGWIVVVGRQFLFACSAVPRLSV
eukprot:GHVT01068908.1.p2 GENE.GHVT01068908.1~~GHVT01068908.1.p2  ORF type:complete len:107 (-),score=3.71 GHVT01068908.1:158-478(-)